MKPTIRTKSPQTSDEWKAEVSRLESAIEQTKAEVAIERSRSATLADDPGEFRKSRMAVEDLGIEVARLGTLHQQALKGLSAAEAREAEEAEAERQKKIQAWAQERLAVLGRIDAKLTELVALCRELESINLAGGRMGLMIVARTKVLLELAIKFHGGGQFVDVDSSLPSRPAIENSGYRDTIREAKPAAATIAQPTTAAAN